VLTDPLLLLAAATLVASVVLAVDLALGLRSLPRVRDAGTGGEQPPVSVVVAARDEAPHIAAAALSMLDQNYPALELVAVDDRSTDGTGEILDRLADLDPRLRVIHVDTLPAGWLGKNHALQRGADAATGSILLFTDADVVMRPGAIARAVSIMEKGGLDHLALAPKILAGTVPATVVVTVFLSLFSAFFRPWRARDPESRWHVGIGAFNLVRAAAYRAIGGHGALPLRPDDDVRLGRALKAAGCRQAAVLGTGSVEVQWYPSLGAMARGLRKNAFAVVDYRLSLVAAGTLLPVVFIFWPVVALFVTTGAILWLNAGVVAVGALAVADTARIHGLPLWTGIAYPLGSLILLWIIWAAALRAVRRGAVEWRGTEYPLELLRQ
jgi:cellulose synthase/poly-beta-1,6-N-acetylglucosamine synthase-like glycosyltransferase